MKGHVIPSLLSSRTVALAAGLLAAGPAFAQQAGDPPVVVTATRTGEGAASASTVISSDEIARLQPSSLIDALNDTAGVRAVSTGGIGGGSFVTIRGGEPNFTLVLVDGIRVNDTTNTKGGGFDFTLIDPALVDRVEVDRGAGSAIHGSDALSGVVNIHLRAPTPGATTVTARLHGGTDGEVGSGVSASYGWRDGGLLLAGSAFDGNHADPGSTLRRAQGLARLRQRIGDYDLVALGMYSDAHHRVFPEDSGGPVLAVNREREHGAAELWTLAASLRHAAEGMVRPNLSISYSGQSSDLDTPAIAPGALDGVPAMTARNRLSRFETIGDVVVDTGALVATIGAALLDERGRSRGTIDYGFPIPADFRLDRTTVSGFAEATLRPVERVTVNAAGRYDSVTGRSGEWTGRADVAFRPVAEGPAVYARIGTGFKLPSFYSLGNPLVGNPDLKPERSRNVEAGLQWEWASGSHARLAWFDNRFTDLIDFDPVLFRTVNRAHVQASGIEAEAAWQVSPAIRLSGALTHLSLDSETPLRGRPRWQGNVHAVWRLSPTIELGGALRFNGAFYDSSIPTGLVRTDGHVDADMSVRYRLSRLFRLDLAVRNLGDARDWEAVGFPRIGRRLEATLTAATF